ncbi:HEXXH motif-containing putative peptide modification protein [Streptomyces sp. NBC_00727]|uniref:aKG-HExxH-type peptide beta-hydroxylase n=1 Tax=Streptomyces sp. NBC_00727 TaxID=2903675 RepID=UPI00386B2B2D
MSGLPTELRDQLRTVDIHERDTARLAAIYHRSVARLLTDALAAAGHPAGGDLGRRVRRLPPALVRRAYSLPATPLSDAEVPGLLSGLEAAAQPPAPAGVLTYDDGSWAQEGAVRATRALAVDDHGAIEVVADPSTVILESLLKARAALAASWDAAWREHNTLVDCMVFAGGPLRSATNQSTFGAVYVSIDEAEDPLRLFEVLLHETGHHSLALRERFTTFLHNAETLSSHPLRKDPRPLRGTLHAAFVLARICRGLARYLNARPASGPLDRDEVVVRLDANRAMLASVMEGMGQAARWTEDGEALHASLLAVLAEQETAEQETAAHEVAEHEVAA